jgi:hypothetical protein
MKYLSLAFLVGGLATHLWAGAISVLNPSFEADVLGCAAGPTCATNMTITDWTGATANPGGFDGNFGESGAFGVFKPSTASYTSIPDGVNVAYIDAVANSTWISQILTATLLANDTYTLNVWIGERADPSVAEAPGQCNGFNASLEAGGNVLNSLVAVGNASCNSLSEGVFTEFTLTYTSGSSPVGLGDPLEIVLTTSGSGSIYEPAELDFDDVSLSDTLSSPGSTVPEPSSLGTMACALGVGIVFLRRRIGL